MGSFCLSLDLNPDKWNSTLIRERLQELLSILTDNQADIVPKLVESIGVEKATELLSDFNELESGLVKKRAGRKRL